MAGWTKVETQSIRVNIEGTGTGQQQETGQSGLKILGGLFLLLLLYLIFRRK